jgi:hypothetical protein
MPEIEMHVDVLKKEEILLSPRERVFSLMNIS